MKLAETVTFGGSGLDRAGRLRGDEAEQARMLAAPEAGVIPLWRGKPLVTGADDALDGAWLRPDHPVLLPAPDDIAPVFLGLDEGRPRFTVDISAWNPDVVPDTLGGFIDPSEQRHPALAPDQRFMELRGAMVRLGPREGELLATAKAILGWHASHGFCANCGKPSVVAMAGWQRNCPACGAHHFPRTDPVVIMLITRGDSVLLGRSPTWPEGMFSLLAGFIEPGETIEGAVRREVFEETGVEVGAVGYLASQPWPFPASLMMGCIGEALTNGITVDANEIERALWLSRGDAMEMLAGRSERVHAPRAGSIARFLLQQWVADRLE